MHENSRTFVQTPVDGDVTSDTRQLMATVARMYYLDEQGQQRIADVVGVSRSTVSRLLAAAREQGVVRISVDEHDPRDERLEALMRKRFGLRHAVVVRTPGQTTASIRGAVGYFAAPLVSTLIQPGTRMGLAGGRTLRELVACLRPRSGVGNVSVAQLMGSFGPTTSEIDALELSRVLAQRFGGTFYTLNAPAIAQDRAMRDLFLAHEQIQLVWRMLGELQLALVSIGSPQESAFIERGILDEATLAEVRSAGAVGEICGRFFDAAGRECELNYRDRVIGIELDVLRTMPEVVGVTAGASRAPAVRAALAGGLVRSLVMDERCAEALLAD
jgi:deoxyribonucleoside regulator